MSEKFPISKSIAVKGADEQHGEFSGLFAIVGATKSEYDRIQLVARDSENVTLYLNNSSGGSEVKMNRRDFSNLIGMALDLDGDLAEIEASEKPKAAVESKDVVSKNYSIAGIDLASPKPAPKPKATKAAPKVAAPKKPAKKK